ncbi:MAG: NAD-dependent deacylase [Spirochaetes bacterium]|nr:NAD-dependent deacylase [Spirochaetota bacterium]
MNDNIRKAADVIRRSQHMISLTGAGISTESGIPDFRSTGGLWEKYDPSIYASIETFHHNPEKVWQMIFDMLELTSGAVPNPGHRALARLEAMGLLKAIITQNIDNLHQEAGSERVIEYHGNASRLECLACGREYEVAGFPVQEKVPPRCGDCGKILKPSVVFFGEMIPHEALSRSQLLAEQADVVMVVGTSAVVYPAAGIPIVAKRNGAAIIEFNVSETDFTRSITDIFIQGKAGETLPVLLDQLAE